jgi:hypothetical protein
MIRFVVYLSIFILSFLVSNSVQAQGFGTGCLGGSPTCVDTKSNTNNNEKISFIKTGEHQLQLRVEKSKLSENEQRSIAGNTFDKINLKSNLVFFQELDFVLDSQILIEKKLNPAYNTVKSGNYPMEIVGDEVIIYLTLTKNIIK